MVNGDGEENWAEVESVMQRTCSCFGNPFNEFWFLRNPQDKAGAQHEENFSLGMIAGHMEKADGPDDKNKDVITWRDVYWSN